jgi:hypothetical protein
MWLCSLFAQRELTTRGLPLKRRLVFPPPLPDSLHKPLTMAQSSYAYTGPSPDAGSSGQPPTASPNRQRSYSGESQLMSPPPTVPCNSSQGSEQVNYAPRRLPLSSMYPPISIPTSTISTQQHQQSPTSPTVWPSPSLDDQRHNIGFAPYLQVGYTHHPGAPPPYSQSPTTALPLDPVVPPIPRWTLAGSLDPTTGIFYRTPEHPRLRTAQACEKCRIRKAKVSTADVPHASAPDIWQYE